MENKAKTEKANRILYLIVVGVLLVSALVIGLVAAFGKDKTEIPENPSTGEQPSTPDTGNPAPDTDADGGNQTPVVYLAPANGVISKSHDDMLPVYSVTTNDWRVHRGIDIATAEGADVYATAAGTVKLIWSDPMMGECLSIDHGNGVVSIYKNLSAEMAKGIQKGASVTSGQKLGTVGSTAMIESADSAHLHFEMEYNGELVDPVTYISEESYESSLSSDTAYGS